MGISTHAISFAAMLLLIFSAPLAPAKPTDSISKSQEIYLHLKNKGFITSKVKFHKNTDPEMVKSVAYVIFNNETKVCDVYIDDQGIKNRGLNDDLSFRFIMYHELVHCEHETNPHQLKVLPRASFFANRAVSDLVRLNFYQIGSDTEGRVANGYMVYHETYADVKALAMMQSEGVSEEQLTKVRNLRSPAAGVFGDSHDTAGVFKKIYEVNWKTLSKTSIEEKAKAIADQHLIKNYFKQNYSHFEWTASAIKSILSSSVSLPISNLRDGYIPKDEEEYLTQRFKEGINSNFPVLKLVAQMDKANKTEDDAVENYFQTRFSVSQENTLQFFEEAAQHLNAAMQSN